ncbi:hypothetical protein THAOC_20928, partial [Thalassiosira oceanica]
MLHPFDRLTYGLAIVEVQRTWQQLPVPAGRRPPEVVRGLPPQVEVTAGKQRERVPLVPDAPGDLPSDAPVRARDQHDLSTTGARRECVRDTCRAGQQCERPRRPLDRGHCLCFEELS